MRLAGGAAAAASALALLPASAQALITYRAASPDAARVYFDTTERLLAADTNTVNDVYMAEGGALTLISVPGAGASPTPSASNFAAATDDGSKVFFSSLRQMVAADTDGVADVYQRSGGVTTLVSAPGAGASGPAASAALNRISDDGSTVLFSTTESLTGADADGLGDVYQHSGETTTLVSVPGAGSTPPAKGVTFAGASADASKVFLLTDEDFIGADSDGLFDVYERSGVATSLVSAPGAGASGPAALASIGSGSAPNGTQTVSDDGSRVFFQTAENLVAADTDGLGDVYERSGGVTTLVSAPGAGASGSPGPADIEGISDDGTKVFFETEENLLAADTDGLFDVYERTAGATTQISVPGAGATSPDQDATALSNTGDGATVFIGTEENWVADDTDGFSDIYRRVSGATGLVSALGLGANGPAGDADFHSASADGSAVLFSSDQSLVAADFDGLSDVYESSAGTVTLVSAPGAGAAGPAGGSSPRALSSDGGRAIFSSTEQLTGSDRDGGDVDVYQRLTGVTTLLSAEAGPPLGAPPETTVGGAHPSFSFSSSESPSTFECRVDSAAFAPCTSPASTAATTAAGAHTFSVRATDFAGNVDPTPGTAQFTIAAPPAPPKKCKKGQKLKQGKCVKKKRKKKRR